MSTAPRWTPERLSNAIYEAHNHHLQALESARMAVERVATTKRRFEELLLAIPDLVKPTGASHDD